jgi:hypothetical protein
MKPIGKQSIAFLIALTTVHLPGLLPQTSGESFEPGSHSQVDFDFDLASQHACDGLPNDSADWLLMRSVSGTGLGDLFNSNRITVSGWTEASYTASNASGNQLPMGFNCRANDFLLQQNWLRVEKSFETDTGVPLFGFIADTIFPGSDYRFWLARGLADDQTASHGFDPVQFYTQMYFPNIAQGLEIKAGRFSGQYDVESIAGVETPFCHKPTISSTTLSRTPGCWLLCK